VGFLSAGLALSTLGKNYQQRLFRQYIGDKNGKFKNIEKSDNIPTNGTRVPLLKVR
jgi:hypothetical protein